MKGRATSGNPVPAMALTHGKRPADPGRSRASGRLVAAGGLLLAGVLARQAEGDVLHLQGGEKLIGQVLSEAGGKVTFQSRTLGRLEIDAAQVERVDRDPAEGGRAGAAAPGSQPGAPARQAPGPKAVDLQKDTRFDWIEIKSGEWLKGRVRSLQEDKLEFDSEELDLLRFDWDKVRQLYSPRPNSVLLEGAKPVDGGVQVTPEEVRVVSGSTTNVQPRSSLVAITPTGARELDRWTDKLSVGLSFRSGNTRETDVSVSNTLKRRTPLTRLEFDYLGNYRKANGEEIELNHRVNAQFDYFLSRRLFVRVPDFEYYRDPLQNIEHRVTMGAGIGYDLVKTARTEWNVTLGPAWQRNWFDSVPEGEDSVADAAAMVVGMSLDFELTRRLDWLVEYRGQWTRGETGDNTHHFVTTLEFEIHKRLLLNLSFIWDRIANPREESGGEAPIPDDFRLTTSLGVDF